MFCGSCMSDNAVAKALIEQGHECLLIPLYTPIRTDTDSVSHKQVFYGGINVYLQQKLPFLRWLPRWFDSALNNANLISKMTANTGKVSLKLLGQMTVSMLKGMDGRQRKEGQRLLQWITTDASIKPDRILFSNLMIAGIAPDLKNKLHAKIWVVLQGDDIFLDALPPPYKKQATDLMQVLVKQIDGFIVHSQTYAEQMRLRLNIPVEKLHILPLGIDTKHIANRSHAIQANTEYLHERNSGDFTIGYLARISPEKGIDLLIDAFIKLDALENNRNIILKVAGYLGPQNKEFWQAQLNKLKDANLLWRFEATLDVDQAGKLKFLQSIDLLCVPTRYEEPKGLFVLESLAAKVPYVLPAHGAFPEVHNRFHAGWLYDPSEPNALVQQLQSSIEQLRQSPTIFSQKHATHLELINEMDIKRMVERKLQILELGENTP